MSRKKTNKIEAETGEVVQSNKPFIIRNGGIAKPLGQGLYLLGGKTHEQGGIDIDFTGDARIFSAQPILNGNSPAELVARGANPNITFNRQERFKDVNRINDDGSRKKAENGKEVKVVPTREEYITSKIDSTINAALNKSRTRKEGITPVLYTINNSDPDIRKNNVESALNRAETFQREALLEADRGNMDIAKRYRQYAINEYELAEKQLTNCSIDTIPGPGCIYTATDNYGKQYRVAGNETFAANPNKYGFVKINTKDRQPGDLQQHVSYRPIHMMLFNGYDEHGKPRYNYSSGEPMKVNANYPIDEKNGDRIDTYRFVGTPADSVRWTNEYNKLYVEDKKRLGGRTKAEWGMEEGSTADVVTDMIPVIGSAKEITRLVKDPSWEQLGWTALSVGGDILGYKLASALVKPITNTGRLLSNTRGIRRAMKPTTKIGRKISNKLTEFSLTTPFSVMTEAAQEESRRKETKKDTSEDNNVWERVDNSNANFVIRLKDPNRKQIYDWASDGIATHKLGVATDENGNHYIFPEVQEIDGELIDFTRPPYSPYAGMISAEERGDTVRVNSIDEGLDFTQNYKKKYTSVMNKKRLGGSTGLIRVQANGKDRLMYVPFTGEETKADRKKAKFGLYNSYDDYLNDMAKKYNGYSITDPSKLTDVQVADINWMHNNLMKTGVDAADRTDYLSSNKGTLYVGQKKTPLSEQRAARKIAGINYAKNYKIDTNRFNPITINPDEIKETKVPEVTNRQVRQQIRAALKKEGLDWTSKNKHWAAPAISALGNIGAGIASYAINKRMLRDLDYSPTPVAKRATKLKTNININPELTALNENLSRTIELTNANTASSRVANARNQAAMLNTTLTANKLYADKENRETALINQDKLNQQEVANANIDAYNTWRTGKTTFENTIREQQSENAISLVDNINKGIQTGITDAERRRQFRNNLAVMAAAYPNVTPELLRTYGVDFLRMGGKVKLNKKK